MRYSMLCSVASANGVVHAIGVEGGATAALSRRTLPGHLRLSALAAAQAVPVRVRVYAAQIPALLHCFTMNQCRHAI